MGRPDRILLNQSRHDNGCDAEKWSDTNTFEAKSTRLINGLDTK